MSLTEASIRNSGLVRALLAQGHLDSTQLDEALQRPIQGRSLAGWLIETGLSAADKMALSMSKHLGFPLFDISQLNPDTYNELDPSLRQSTKGLDALVLGQRNGTLYVGVVDPTDLSIQQQIKFRTQLLVEPVVVEHDKLSSFVSKSNQAEASSQFLSEEEASEGAGDSAGEDVDIDDAPIVRFVQRVLQEALDKGASDIHFEPYEKHYRIRLRIDGQLQETVQPPLAAKSKIAARIKIMSRLNTTETRTPQDGRMRISSNTEDRKIDFRVSTLPTLFGEKIVLRILNSNTSMMKLDHLGLTDAQIVLVEKALEQPHGMILVTGPTGSGKTVSLYTFLMMLNKENVNISTVEDPAEIHLNGVNQVNINERIGLTFAKALRALLRQDPDIIMVGEIRDFETADISIKASQTGHMVLSTLHTNDASQTIVRLRNMGVETFNIASSINLIIAQRLVRKLCTCKQPHPLGNEALVTAGLIEKGTHLDSTPFCAVGCDACNGTGYKGRVGIYEVMPLSENMQELILKGANALELEQQGRSEGVLGLKDAGTMKVLQGITTIEEILAATRTD